MELIDVLTPDGARTGTRKPKAEVHRDGDWHRAAHLWIVQRDGRLLLQRRSSLKENWPGLWDISVAGHVSAGEEPEAAAVREAGEELGLAVNRDDFLHIGTTREQYVLNGGAYLDNEFQEIFVLTRDVDLGALVLDPNEVEAVAFAAPDELARFDLVPHAEEYALLRRYLQSC
ncbi:MAG TPA: NUDIX domain-containing protein [Thermoanaerobaculia bacterium]|nr:NUDIX domain-containing protein [Thermoanaerobaculia bacterium]